jgi:hypothetical protein
MIKYHSQATIMQVIRRNFSYNSIFVEDRKIKKARHIYTEDIPKTVSVFTLRQRYFRVTEKSLKKSSILSLIDKKPLPVAVWMDDLYS